MIKRSSDARFFLRVSLFALSGVVLLLAYAAIALHTGNAWPWFEVVHESGKRTLIGTILYFEHAARELPLDLLLGIAVGGSALHAFPYITPPVASRRRSVGVLTVLVVATILLGTLWFSGLGTLWENLLQMPTRPGEALVVGAHWHYHLLSRLTLMLLSIGLAGLLVAAARVRPSQGGRVGLQVFGVALILFLIVSAVFRFRWNPFMDPVFLGHQVREIFTHVLVTLPIAWAVCLRRQLRLDLEYRPDGTRVTWALVGGGVGVLVGLFVFFRALRTSAISQGQTDSVVLLVFPHFFEHALSYIVVALVAGLVYEWGMVPRKIT